MEKDREEGSPRARVPEATPAADGRRSGPDLHADTSWLIRGAEIGGRAGLDLRIASGIVIEIGTGLVPCPDERSVEAADGCLLPGLVDHHVHLLALAAAALSLRCGPDACRDGEALRRVLRAATPRDGWLRGIDYHESVAGDLDRDALDALRDDVPVRIQHRSGALWMLNSRAIAHLDLENAPDLPGIERDEGRRPTGRFHRLDDWLRERTGPTRAPDLASVGRRLAGFGYTGLTDATPGNGPAELALFERAKASGALPQALRLMGGDTLPEPGRPGIVRGERKILLDDARLPALSELEVWIAEAHAAERGVAVHCVTRAELFLALAAFAAKGVRPGDRIEHAAVTPPEALEALRALGLVVVTQPNFVRERGDAYLRDVDPVDQPWLYRGRAFAAAGIPLAAGSDAPFGDPDPWAAMAAAVDRRSRTGACLGEAEALSPEHALKLFQPEASSAGERAQARATLPVPRIGAPADLCLLRVPWRRMRERLDASAVRATWIRGRGFGLDAG